MENQEKVLNSAEEAKIYTQSDMNNITSKIESKKNEYFENLTKANEELAKVKSEFETFKNQTLEANTKTLFENNGGNLEAWEVFKKANNDLMYLPKEQAIEKLNILRKEQSYFFNQEQPKIQLLNVQEEQKVMKEVLKENEGNDEINPYFFNGK